MKKIPTLFRRDPDNLRHVLPEVTPGCEWVLAGEGCAHRKLDGTCVLIRRDGMAVKAYARREVKPGKEPPPNFREVDHDPVTDKRVGWEPAEQSGFARLINEAIKGDEMPGTYELCGPKVNGNPEHLDTHVLLPHRFIEFDTGTSFVPLDFDTARDRVIELSTEGWEGIVWHHPDGRMAKLKAKDFR